MIMIRLITFCICTAMFISTTQAQYTDYTPDGEWIEIEIQEIIDSSNLIVRMMSVDSIVSFYLLADGNIVKLSANDDYESVESIMMVNDRSYLFAIDTMDQNHIIYHDGGVVTEITPAGNYVLKNGAKLMTDSTVVIFVEEVNSLNDYIVVLHESHSEIIQSMEVYSRLLLPSNISDQFSSSRVYMGGIRLDGEQVLAYYDVDYGLIETSIPFGSLRIINKNPSDLKHTIICNPSSTDSIDANIYRVNDSTFTIIPTPLLAPISIQVLANFPDLETTLFTVKDTSDTLKIVTREAGNIWTDVTNQFPSDLSSILTYYTNDSKYIFRVRTTDYWEFYYYDGVDFNNITPAEGPFKTYSIASSSTPTEAMIILQNETNEEYLYSIDMSTPVPSPVLINPNQQPFINISDRSFGIYTFSKYWDESTDIINEGLFKHVALSDTLISVTDKGEIDNIRSGLNNSRVLIKETDTLNITSYYAYDYSTVTPLIIPAYDTSMTSTLETKSKHNVLLFTTTVTIDDDDDDDDDDDRRLAGRLGGNMETTRLYGSFDELVDLTHPYMIESSNAFDNFNSQNYNDYKSNQVAATFITTNTSGLQTYRLMTIKDAPQSSPCNVDDKIYYNPDVTTDPTTGNHARRHNYIGLQNTTSGNDYHFTAGESSELLPGFEIANSSEMTIIQKECRRGGS